MSEGQDGHKLTARQKAAMYITTVSILGFIYLAPELFKFIGSLPETAWTAVTAPLKYLVIGMVLVAFYAIWSVFSTGKMAIRKDAERERAERMAQREAKGES